MKRLICVELLEEYHKANFYSIRFNDEKESLFDQFITDFSTNEFENDLSAISYWIEKIGEKGALERHFKPEGHPKVKALPLPPPSSKLRLYCFRISEQIVIMGGGDIKKVRAFQDDEKLARHVLIVKKVGKKIERYLEQNKIIIDDKELSGKLTFEIEL